MATLCRNVSQFARVVTPSVNRGLSSAAPAAASGGMNFNMSSEQKELVDLAEKFTRDEIIPNAAHYDQVSTR